MTAFSADILWSRYFYRAFIEKQKNYKQIYQSFINFEVILLDWPNYKKQTLKLFWEIILDFPLDAFTLLHFSKPLVFFSRFLVSVSLQVRAFSRSKNFSAISCFRLCFPTKPLFSFFIFLFFSQKPFPMNAKWK